MLCKASLVHGYNIVGAQNIQDWLEASGNLHAYSPTFNAEPVRRKWWLPKTGDEQEQLAQEADAEFQAELAALGASIDIDGLVELGKQWCMHCMTDECSCGNFLSFYTVDDKAVALFPYPSYLMGGGCKECVYEYTVECVPYREFLKEWVDDQNATPQPVSRCKDFLPSVPQYD